MTAFDPIPLLEELLGEPLGPATLDQGFVTLGLDSLELLELHQVVQAHSTVPLDYDRLHADLDTPRRLRDWLAAPATAPAEVPAAAPAPRVREEPGPPGELAAYPLRTAGSRARVDAARTHLANNRASAGYHPAWRDFVHPIVVDHASGAHFVDVDGNRWLDFCMGFGVHLFGHAPAFVREALSAAMERGMPLGPLDPRATTVAAQICALTGHDRVAFYNSGTEAVMVALRLARAATGRDRIVRFRGSYHGTVDGVLALPAGDGSVPAAPGIPASAVADTVVLPYGSESLGRLAELAPSLAAVLVEPVQSRDPGHRPEDFLRELRTLCTEHGIALIFDEMITGFRVAPGGAAAKLGIRPDLATYGKVLGGGLPIGVVAGSERFLEPVDGGVWRSDGTEGPGILRTFVAGTFCHHPLTLAAAEAVLAELGRTDLDALSRRTATLVGRLNAIFLRGRVSLRAVSHGSLFRFEHPGTARLFHALLLDAGIYLWEGRTCYLSTAHTDADLDQLVSVVEDLVRTWGEQLVTGAWPEGAELGVEIVVTGGLHPDRLDRAWSTVISRHGPVARLEQEEELLRIVGHRGWVDGWSIGVLLQELSKAYAGHRLGPVDTARPPHVEVQLPTRRAYGRYHGVNEAPLRAHRRALRSQGRTVGTWVVDTVTAWCAANGRAAPARPVAGQRTHGMHDAVGSFTRLVGPEDATVVVNVDRIPPISFGTAQVDITSTLWTHTAHDLVLNTLDLPDRLVFELKLPRDLPEAEALGEDLIDTLLRSLLP